MFLLTKMLVWVDIYTTTATPLYITPLYTVLLIKENINNILLNKSEVFTGKSHTKTKY